MQMKIVKWDVPVVALYRRSVELVSLEYKGSKVCLTLTEEEYGRAWRAQFEMVQAFKCVTWECGAHTLSNAPDGGFFEIMGSPLLEELGLGLHEFLEKSRHFVVSTYNDIVHVVAWSCEFVLVEAAAST
jgi:hypothetical protein